MKYIKFIIILLVIGLFTGCSSASEKATEGLRANSEIQLDWDKLPLNLPVIHVNIRELCSDLSSLASKSDLILIGKVNSVYPAFENTLVFNNNANDGLSSWYTYSYNMVTKYEIEATKILKGSHCEGELIELSFPTDNKHILWNVRYSEPDKLMDVDKEYLIFMSCWENNITDETHNIVTAAPSWSIYPINGNVIGYTGFLSNWLEEYDLISLQQYIITNHLDVSTEETGGEIIEKYYSSPENYMCVLSDTCSYQSEFSLTNTSDDIIIGKITKAEDFSGEIIDFSGEKTWLNGQLLRVKISESLKGVHKAGEIVEIFIRQDDEYKDKFLGGSYKKGCDGLFFMSCMDHLSSAHLLNGELQASIIFNNDNVYNRANFTEEAQSTGFFTESLTEADYPLYRILFSDCFTKDQIIKKINECMISLPDRMTYGEYLKSLNITE